MLAPTSFQILATLSRETSFIKKIFLIALAFTKPRESIDENVSSGEFIQLWGENRRKFCFKIENKNMKKIVWKYCFFFHVSKWIGQIHPSSVYFLHSCHLKGFLWSLENGATVGFTSLNSIFSKSILPTFGPFSQIRSRTFQIFRVNRSYVRHIIYYFIMAGLWKKPARRAEFDYCMGEDMAHSSIFVINVRLSVLASFVIYSITSQLESGKMVCPKLTKMRFWRFNEIIIMTNKFFFFFFVITSLKICTNGAERSKKKMFYIAISRASAEYWIRFSQ